MILERNNWHLGYSQILRDCRGGDLRNDGVGGVDALAGGGGGGFGVIVVAVRVLAAAGGRGGGVMGDAIYDYIYI